MKTIINDRDKQMIIIIALSLHLSHQIYWAGGGAGAGCYRSRSEGGDWQSTVVSDSGGPADVRSGPTIDVQFGTNMATARVLLRQF